MTTWLGHLEGLLALPVHRHETTETIVIHRHSHSATEAAHRVSDAAAPGTACMLWEELHA